jgi:hypothetical protein
VGFFITSDSNYLTSTESTNTAVVSTAIVESVQTSVESHDLTSVVVPLPQEANTTIANNATIFLIIVFFLFVYKNLNIFL